MTETVNGTSGDDTITTYGLSELINGLVGNDTINARDGDDIVNGGDGNDILKGEAGNDRLIGGLGNDTADGGIGADTFVFDVRPKTANFDHIVNFEIGIDKIELDHDVYKKLKIGDLKKKAFYAHKNADHAKDGKDRIVVNTKSGECWYDKDGKGGAKAKLFAILDEHPTDISQHDFIIVA